MNRSKSRLPVIARKDGYAMNRFDRDRLDAMGKEALSRVEELMNTSRINELMHKREEDEKKRNCILWITVSLHLIIWKILRMISTTISTMISSRMRSL